MLGNFGALGNQLWQIAGTIGTAAEMGAEASFPVWDYQPYFQVPSALFSGRQGDLDLGGNYLQDLKHFAFIQDSIRKYFKPSYPVEADILETYNDVFACRPLMAVHWRRGNNLDLPDHHPVCDISYFEQAISMFPNYQLVVFSDDLDFCRKQSIFKNAYFAAGNDPSIDVRLLTNEAPLSLYSVVKDLHFMAMCDAHIISNSSFSWWGAWLADGDVVVRPERWYGKAYTHLDVECMMPPHWISL